MEATIARSAPLSDAIIIAVSALVDDAQADSYRQPSHSEITFEFERVDLAQCDPNSQGNPVGKAKRVRAVLSWALENDPEAGEQLVSSLVAHVRACGGFRPDSSNYVGQEAITNAKSAFREEGYDFASTGELRPIVLDTLEGAELTSALKAYSRRAKRGAEDAALVTGTGKDLLEATAAHIITERSGGYPTTANFPTLLGQAFIQLGLSIPNQPPTATSPSQARFQSALYDAACAVNNLRNKQGTGHGRPWLPTVTDDEARAAIELMGAIAEYLLGVHGALP